MGNCLIECVFAAEIGRNGDPITRPCMPAVGFASSRGFGRYGASSEIRRQPVRAILAAAPDGRTRPPLLCPANSLIAQR